MRLLLVEDNLGIADIVERLLTKEGYVVDTANTLRIAKAAITDVPYDLVIIDRMLPDGEGLDLIRFCKEKRISNRYLVLSALNELGQRIEGLDSGANDYIAKPFEPEELKARVRALLRPPLVSNKESMSYGNVTYDGLTNDILIDEEPLVLPRREKLVLEMLIKRFNRVVAREVLKEAVYSYDDDICSNSLESHISKLRKNLSKENSGLAIHTIRGVGYILKEDA